MYLKHGLIYLLAKIAPALASFVSVAAYTRWLSTEEYGVYTTLLVLVSSMNGFLFGWLYVGIMRFWNAQDVSAEAVQRLISFAVVVISGCVGLLAAGYALLAGNTLIAASFFLLFTSSALYESYQRVKSITQQVRRYLLAEVVRTLLTLVIGLLLVWVGYSWAGAMGGVALGIFLTLLFSGGIWRYLRVNWREIDYAILRKVLLYGLPLSLSFVLLDVIFTSDRLLLSFLAGYSEAGQYAVAYNLPHQIIMMLTSSLNLAAYPVVIRALEHEGQQQAEEKLQQYFLLLMGVAVPAIFGLIGISKAFIPLLIGPEFVSSSLRMLPWIGLAVLEHCVYMFYVSLSFQLGKRTGDAVKVVAVAASINLILNMILIPQFGMMGAISGSILSYLICLIYGYVLGRSGFNLMIPWLELSKVLLASVVMLVMMEQIPDRGGVLSVVIRMLVGIMVYTLMVLTLNIGDMRLHVRTMSAALFARYQRVVEP